MLFQVNLASQTVCQADPCWEEPSEKLWARVQAGPAAGRGEGGPVLSGFGMSIWGSTQNWEAKSILASEQRASILPWCPLTGL